jgi:hypothetical protein
VLLCMFMMIVSVASHLLLTLPKNICTRYDGKGKDHVRYMFIPVSSHYLTMLAQFIFSTMYSV